jgi:hypothetical protein
LRLLLNCCACLNWREVREDEETEKAEKRGRGGDAKEVREGGRRIMEGRWKDDKDGRKRKKGEDGKEKKTFPRAIHVHTA